MASLRSPLPRWLASVCWLALATPAGCSAPASPVATSLPPAASASAAPAPAAPQEPSPTPPATTYHQATDAPPAPCAPSGPRPLTDLPGTGLRAKVVAPACVGSPSHLLLYLHSACDSPETECPAFAGDSTRDMVVVCPRGQVPCGAGGATWNLDSSLRAQAGPGVLQRLAERQSLTIEPGAGTIVGLSQGARAAVDLAERSRATFRYLIVMGMVVEPDVARLKAAGIRAVVFASGHHDPARPGMERLAAQVARSGLRARYLSLGDVGHALARDMDAFLREAFSWLEREDSAGSGAPSR